MGDKPGAAGGGKKAGAVRGARTFTPPLWVGASEEDYGQEEIDEERMLRAIKTDQIDCL